MRGALRSLPGVRHESPSVIDIWDGCNVVGSWREVHGRGLEAKHHQGTHLLDFRNCRNCSIDVFAMTDSDNYPLACPDGLAYKPFQEEGIRYGLNIKRFLLGDDMGLGKTVQAIGVLNNDSSLVRTLIVCPAHLKQNWEKELKTWLIPNYSVQIIEGAFDFDEPADMNAVFVISYDLLFKRKAWLDSQKWHMLIYDEAQNLSSRSSLRTRTALGAKFTRMEKVLGKKLPQRVLYDFGPIPCRKGMFLTGTPMSNRPEELFPILERLDPQGLGRSWWAYAKRYCRAHRGRWGWDTKGASHLKELNTKIRESGIMLRRLKSVVMPELPPKRRQVIQLSSRGHEKIIEKELEIYENSLKKKKKKLGADYSCGELAKLRHQVALIKVPDIRTLLASALEGGPVVCFCWHQDVVDALAVGFNCSVLTGRTPHAKRQEQVDMFQEGHTDLFLGNLEAAGTGHTLTRSAHVMFAEIDWVPTVLTQAEDRCHRIGATAESILIQHVVLKDSLDERMLQLIMKKQAIIDKVIDGA